MDRESIHSSGSNTGGKKIVSRKGGSTVIPVGGDGTLSAAKQEEWTTSRKVVNHKTKQVETRVQRQIIMEDGKVIADSGPQVTTKTKEDQKKEETENTNHRNIGDIDAPPRPGYAAVAGGNQVVDEKTETHQSSREAKEENMQYHDESFKELSGLEVHRKALQAPNDLIKIDDESSPDRPKGKLIHYSSKSHKINDSEEVKETSRLERDGKVTTETTRTHHHEEFDDDELPEDNTEVKALPAASTQTTRKIEYLKDYEDGFNNFPKAMNNQNTRAIEVEKSNYNRDNTRKSYAHNEENVKNTSTTRWLDDHFGSDESDIVETSNTRTGKNVINVSKTGRTSTPISAYTGDYHTIDKSRNVSHQQKLSRHSSPQKYTTTATHYVKDSRTPSPRSSPNEYYVRPSSQFKEDASIQASLSDEDDGRINDFRTSYNEKKVRVSDVRSGTPNKPEKTFYFGDDSVQRKNYRNDRQEYLNQQNTQQRNAYTIERDSKVEESMKSNRQHEYKQSKDVKEGGYVSANVQTKVFSTLNDKVINDSATNENFERRFKDDFERRDAHHNLNRLMDKSWTNTQNLNTSNEDSQYWSGSKSRPQSIEYIHHPVIEDDVYSGRRDPSTRQRNFDSYASPPPLYSGTSKYNSNGFSQNLSQNKEYKYNYSSSPSPPLSPTGGTWTKSKGRAMSPLYRSSSPTDHFPQFSPLTSPLEIKNFTDSYTNGKNFSSN